MTQRWKNLKLNLAKNLVRQRRLTWSERLSTRVGYFGAGFLIAGQWTLEPMLFIVGFICVVVQTSARKQWNLVALNINGLVAWIKHFLV